MSSTNNLGQVVGLFIGTTPPINTTLIWYDSTPNQLCHKVYNPTTKMWQALDPEIISITTYSELVNNAKKNGLVIGKQYQIRDKNNVLATAITPTKVYYIDNGGNILIDDLGVNIQFHVSSSNILIDDVSGVLDATTNKLLFSFQEDTPDIDTDYFFGKIRRGTKWILAKFKFTKLLSSDSQNSITWKDGFYFNFSAAIRNILDKVGGVVSMNTYNKKMQELDTAIGNVSKENQNIINDASDAITEQTKDEKIYGKKLPINIDTTIAPGDIQRLDTLSTIVSKIQRWINSFKYATGVRLSSSFKDATSAQYINNNDTVETAFSKIQYYLKNPTSIYKLPSDFDKSTDVIPEGKELPVANDTFYWAFLKLTRYLKNILTLVKLPSDWKPISYTANFKTPDSGDSLSTVISKLVGKFNQIGVIYNGVIESRKRNDETTSQAEDSGTPKLKIDLNQGIITSRHQAEAGGIETYAILSAKDGLKFGADSEDDLIISKDRFEYRGQNWRYYNDAPYKIVNAQGGKFPIGVAIFNQGATAFSAKNLGTYGYNYYDAFFSNVKLGGVNFDAVEISSNYYVNASTSMVLCSNTSGNNINVYLPANPETGRTVFIVRGNNGGINVYAQGNNGIDKIGSSSTNVAVESRGQIYMFVFARYTYYSGEERVGLWQFARLIH